MAVDPIALVLALQVLPAMQPATGQDVPAAIEVHSHVLALPELPIPPALIPTMATAISANGEIVMLSVSDPTGLSAGRPSSALSGTWVHDVAKGETRELHLQRDGKPWKLLGRSGLSADGRFVASACAPDLGPLPEWSPGATAPDLAPVATLALIDLANDTSRFVGLREHGCNAPLAMPDRVWLSGDGSLLAIGTTPDFGHGINHGWTMLWNSADDSLRPLVLDDAYYGLDAPEISADGRWLLADSFSKDDVRPAGLLRLNCATSASEFVCLAPDGRQLLPQMWEHSLSADGQRVVFVSRDMNAQVPSRTDVYVRDLASGKTQRVSLAPDGSDANGGSSNCDISGDGRYVAFASQASNLVAPPDDALPDLFVRELSSGRTARVRGEDFAPGGGTISLPALSNDGQRVVFCVGVEGKDTRIVLADISWGTSPR